LDIDWHLNLIALFILFLLSAFFSGSEVALFSLNRKKIKKDLEANPLIGRYILYLIEFPRRLLVTVLLGNTIVNVAASIVAVTLALEYAANSSMPRDVILTIQIVVLTAFVIIFGELTPKVWASKSPLTFAKIVAVPLYWISVIIYPIAEVLTEAIRLLISKINMDKTKLAILPEEIPELAELGHERGTLVEEEHGLIQSIVGFRSVTVQEVMTPRVDMVSISADYSFEKIINIITSSGHSRIPLYNEDLDEILGIIYSKDILPYLKNIELRKSFSLVKIARKAMFIPKTKMINELMPEFQEKKTHIAIVVDEYGGTAGLVTLEDIIEEIIGEIRDEYDKEENPITKVDDNSYSVLGKISVDELNELLNTSIPNKDEDFETLGGLVLNQAGHIPKEGYTFQLENHKFTVKEVLKKRIKKVLVEKLPSE
jgi:magnesium and cobalt exporter, CNNM family